MTEWFREWPTKEGWYWFHGVTHTPSGSEKARMVPVNVRHAGSDDRKFWMYVANGAFLHESEGARGLWLPMTQPEPPDVGCSGPGRCHGDAEWCDHCGCLQLAKHFSEGTYKAAREAICHLPDCEHHPKKRPWSLR
jgi:hypothetical protein